MYKQNSGNSGKIAPVLPMSRKEMKCLGWESCDVIIVTGDAYVDHPSFGMAVIGRVLEARGFRVGIIAQPDWHSKDAFMALGRPNLMFGITAGNMDSMVNRYTANHRIRSNDAYTPDDQPGKRPDRSVIVYSQRCREAYSGVPIVIGGIEASLRRCAHYDYWSDKIRRSIVLDSKADILIYGNGERQIIDIAHRLAKKESIKDITDLRGTVFPVKDLLEGWNELNLTEITDIEPLDHHKKFLAAKEKGPGIGKKNSGTVIRLPSYNQICDDPLLYAFACRIMHVDFANDKSCAFVQLHDNRDIWINPPTIPLSTDELDGVYELPFTRLPHPSYGEKKIPAYEMIRFSVTIMRGCFGGCAFCSISAHEGRIIQSRSEESIIREIERVRDSVPSFTGTISDLGGPTANMYRMRCSVPNEKFICKRLSCLYPKVCKNLYTDHGPLIKLYRKSRKIPGIKKVLIGSGVRYDLAVKSPEYIKELAEHHVGGYLKIAPEHTEKGPLNAMMKPEIDCYSSFKAMFDKYSKMVGKKQYLIPYFIAAHPGTTTEDMVELALWLKKNSYRLEQVQTFLPSPMTIATAMYHTGNDIFYKIERNGNEINIPRGLKIRRLHKAFLLYHKSENWPLLCEALRDMGRGDLIGSKNHHLIPDKGVSKSKGKHFKGTGGGKRKIITHTKTRRHKG